MSSIQEAQNLLINGRVDESEKIFRELIDNQDQKTVADADNGLGLVYLDKFKTDEALGYFGQALGIYKKLGDKKGEGNTLGNMFYAYKQKKDNGKALECLDESARIHKELGLEYQLSQDYYGKALILEEQANYAEAIGYMEHSFEIISKLGDKLGIANVHFGRANLYKHMGQKERAIEDFTEALKIAKEIDVAGKEGFIENIEKQIEELGG